MPVVCYEVTLRRESIDTAVMQLQGFGAKVAVLCTNVNL